MNNTLANVQKNPQALPGTPGIAVIGTGYWGKNLVRNYANLGALKMICDKDEITTAYFKKQHSGLETCTHLGEILRREDIQGLVISTPAETHFSIAREALLAGKHVYVEKPLALIESEAKELIKLAEENGLILMVGHLLQYHPVFLRLKHLASAGELGRINYIYSHRLNLGKIRREENILWSFAPHDISMILSLAEEEPQSVLSTGGNYLHSQIADVTTTHLEFSSGLRAHIFVSWLHPFKEQKLVVVGDKKMAVFDDTKPWNEKLLIYPHEIKWKNNFPTPSKAEAERTLDITEGEPLRLECEQFLKCIMTGKKPFTDGQEGFRVMRVLNASQKSLDASGKKIYLQQIKNERTSSFHSLPAEPINSEGRVASNFVHPTAMVDDNVSIGSGTKIWHFSHVLPGSTIGKNCNIGQNVVIGQDVIIGNGCKIQNNVSVYKGVTLEDNVFCGPSMVFTNVHNPRAHIRRMEEIRPTLVRTGATIGANATVICGNKVGSYAFIGAGAVVTKDVPEHALVLGNPARQIGWICRCGEKLNSDLACSACKLEYKREKEGLHLK